MPKNLLFVLLLLPLVVCSLRADERSGLKKSEVPPEHIAQSKEGLKLFREHIRGVLEKHCLDCHGGKSTKADFNLGSRKQLMESGFVEKKAADSYLMELIRHEAEPEMPFKAEKLSDETINLIAQWIDLGAPYDKPLIEQAESKSDEPMKISETDRQFWSFKPLDKVSIPDITQDTWSRTSIDKFILEKLRAKKIAPNSEASRRVLIRRAYLDLIGMPPTPEEVDAFVDDPDADAFDKVVDHLLRSKHYGERWARHWMDVARFAESTGFEHDYDRNSAYHYRDFLIQAFNQDMSWDRMVRLQLAGDELEPNNRLSLMATGFLAAGVFPTQLTEAEFESARYDELDDIVATTGVAFLGLSTGCARCHDHKFDPIPTRDYYSLAATFATTIRSERQVVFNPEEHQQKLEVWEAKRARLEDDFKRFESQVFEPQFERWLSKPEIPEKGTLGNWLVPVTITAKSNGGAKLSQQPDGSWLASGKLPNNDEFTIEADVPAGTSALRIEALTDKSLPRNGPGRAGNGNFALGDLVVVVQEKNEPEAKKFRVQLTNARATHQQNETSLSVASSIDTDIDKTGWAVDFGGIGKDQAAVFEFASPLDVDSRLTVRMRFHLNTKHSLGRFRLSTSLNAKSDFELGASTDQELVEAMNALSSSMLAANSGSPPITRSQREQIRKWYAERDGQWLGRRAPLDSHLASKPKPDTQTVLVCSEGVKPMKHHADGRGYPHFYPDVHLLARGDTKQKGEVMRAGHLQVLGGKKMFEDGDDPDTQSPLSYRRTRFSRWLTDPKEGAGRLVARVVVNRLWQHHFGEGIVSTPNDFGFQGARPTHPELLDWLAADLIANDWKLKRLHKLMVTSSVYRQSTTSDGGRMAVDVDNKLLWRFKTRRLEAEAIRDSLLAVSGQIDPTMFGPGSLDERMRRRSIYFKVKRSQFVPMMQVFDWPEHLVSIGRRTNTAIAPQALSLMNGVHVRGYAESLAKRIQQTSRSTRDRAISTLDSTEDRVNATYLQVFTRRPTSDELKLASQFLVSQAERYPATGDRDLLALTDFCQALFCSNEFLYLP